MTAAVWISIIVALVLAGAIAYLALRLSTRRASANLILGLFTLAVIFGIVAIFSVTFFRKAVSA